jgi:hypothetical protein
VITIDEPIFSKQSQTLSRKGFQAMESNLRREVLTRYCTDEMVQKRWVKNLLHREARNNGLTILWFQEEKMEFPKGGIKMSAFCSLNR